MPNKLKVGIVGCGGVAQQEHIPGFLRLNNVVLQAVCDKNDKLAQQTAAKYRIPQVYSSLPDMFSAEKLDIIDICTPPQTHAPLALEALQNGCHVLMEKPMALKTSDCDEMIDASRKSGAKLCIIHNKLFQPTFFKARRLVAEGVIGDFVGMRIFLSDPREEMIMRKDYWVHKLPGGLIGETGPHVVYMSLAFLNSVKSVDIYAQNFLEHPWAPFDEFRIELEGERAILKYKIDTPSIRILDIGCGNGFYVDIWRQKGVRSLTGIDITAISVKELSIKYPTFSFYEADISSPTLIDDLPLGRGEFDIVTAFDILFHIVDDDKFEQAIKNIGTLCSENGFIFITDLFLHKQPYVILHQKSRLLEEYISILSKQGIKIIDRIPVHYLLGAPLDIPNKLLQKILVLFWWRGVVGMTERTTHLLGPCFFALDSVLTRLFNESPSTEMIICKLKKKSLYD